MPHSTTYQQALHDSMHREVVTYLVYRDKLARMERMDRYSYPEPGYPEGQVEDLTPDEAALWEAESVSAYPETLSDLPIDGWVWYDESEAIDSTGGASNA